MADNRGQHRFLCSELVTVHWRDVFRRKREEVVNLEEIWASGATLQFSRPVREGALLRVTCRGAEFSGIVTRSTADFVGHIVEVEFEDGYEWSRQEYEPEHFFDPWSLLPEDELKQKNDQLLKDCVKDLPQWVA